MNRMTIKAYAVKHKLSIFNVMKMVRTDKVKSEEVEVDGKNVLYILLDEEIEKEIKKGIVPIVEGADIKKLTLEEEVEKLKKEVQALRLELDVLKRKV